LDFENCLAAKNVVEIWKDGRYTDEARQGIMELYLETRMGSMQVPKALQICANMFGVKFNHELPSPSTIQNIGREAGILADAQLAQIIGESESGYSVTNDSTSWKRQDLVSSRISLRNQEKIKTFSSMFNHLQIILQRNRQMHF